MAKEHWTLKECLEREKFYANGEEKMGKHGYHSSLAKYLDQLQYTKLIFTGIYCVGDITEKEGMKLICEKLKEYNENEQNKRFDNS